MSSSGTGEQRDIALSFKNGKQCDLFYIIMWPKWLGKVSKTGTCSTAS